MARKRPNITASPEATTADVDASGYFAEEPEAAPEPGEPEEPEANGPATAPEGTFPGPEPEDAPKSAPEPAAPKAPQPVARILHVVGFRALSALRYRSATGEAVEVLPGAIVDDVPEEDLAAFLAHGAVEPVTE